MTVLVIQTTPPSGQEKQIKHPKPTSNMVKIIDEQTENAIKINVMDVPSRMQETLRKLLRQKGLKKKPFQRFSKKPVAILDTTKEFSDFQPPHGKQDTLLRPLQGNHDGVVKGLKTPSTKQNTLLRNLVGSHDETIRGLKHPSHKQDTLLRPLVGSHNENVQGLKHPSLKQDTLLNQLTPGHKSQVSGLNIPHNKQNTLLRNLKANDHGIVENIRAPHNKQNTLLRNLKPNDKGHVGNLQIPKADQDTLLRNLKDSDVGFVKNLRVPHHKQNTLLRNLKSNEKGRVTNLRTPGIKQDTLLKPLVGNDFGNHHGLKVPSVIQNPLLKPLTPNSNKQIKNLKTLPRKEDLTLLKNLRQNFRKLKGQKNDRTINLLPPKRIRRPQHTTNFDPNILATPNERQNPLLRILRFDERERVLRKGLSPPNFNQYPLFQQVLRTPQKYHKEFLQLPQKDQNKLMEILRRHGGVGFDANAILIPPPNNRQRPTNRPKPQEKNKFKPSPVLSAQPGRNGENGRNRVSRPIQKKPTSHRTTPIRTNIERQPQGRPKTMDNVKDQEKSLEKGETRFCIAL